MPGRVCARPAGRGRRCPGAAGRSAIWTRAWHRRSVRIVSRALPPRGEERAFGEPPGAEGEGCRSARAWRDDVIASSGNQGRGVWGSGRWSQSRAGRGAGADTLRRPPHHDFGAWTASLGHGAHTWAQGAPRAPGALGHRSALPGDLQLLWSRGGAAVLGEEVRGDGELEPSRPETPDGGLSAGAGQGAAGTWRGLRPGNVDECGWRSSGNAIRPAIEFIGQIKFGRLCEVLFY